MNCMKCGREVALGQVFCKECLSVMEQHPVKPDTPVQLPNRAAMAAGRRSTHSRKTRKPEEQISRLRKLVVIQTLALLAVLAGLVITILIVSGQMGDIHPQVLPGQNYSTVETILDS